MLKWNILFLDCPSHESPKSHHKWWLLHQLGAVWGLRKQLTRNYRATGGEAMLFVIIITNPLRKQDNVWVGCTERLKFQPALELNSFDSELFVFRGPEDTQNLSFSRPFPSWAPTQPLEGMPSSEADNPSPNKPFLSFFPFFSRPGSVLSCPIVLPYHIKSWHGTKQLNVVQECGSIRSNPCQFGFPEPLPWILGEVWSIKAAHFHISVVSRYPTPPKTPCVPSQRAALIPSSVFVGSAVPACSQGNGLSPIFPSQRSEMCQKVQCLNPRPGPVVSGNARGILHEFLGGLQKLSPHQHRDFNPYKE